jgi:hypothetical protein
VTLRLHPRPARLYLITSLFRYFLISSRKSLTPSESALTKNAPVTLLESALTKCLNLKSFRIRTYKIRRGEGSKRLTRSLVYGWASRNAPRPAPADPKRAAPAPNRYLITSLPHYVASVPQVVRGTLFVSQRDHGVDQGRAAGWDVAGRQGHENEQDWDEDEGDRVHGTEAR